MRLYEYQSKNLLSKYDVPVTDRVVASDVNAAADAGHMIGFPVVVKAQAKASSRGKAGGVKRADNESELREYTQQMLGSQIRGNKVTQVLIEEAIDSHQELYLGISLDREQEAPIIMASTAGGVDIEKTATKSPEKIVQELIQPLLGLQPYQARNIVSRAGIDHTVASDIVNILLQMYRLWNQYNALEVEINPLMLTEDGVVAADAVVRVDDSALHRVPDVEDMESKKEQTPEERIAESHGFDYVPLDGNIGVIGNGAGLVMSILDTIKLRGGSPANFLDVKGNTNEHKIENAIDIVLSQQGVDQAIVSVFGGMTKCDDVARGVVSALDNIDTSNQTVLVQLVGTNQQQGKQILAQEEIPTYSTLEDAIDMAIEVNRGESR